MSIVQIEVPSVLVGFAFGAAVYFVPLVCGRLARGTAGLEKDTKHGMAMARKNALTMGTALVFGVLVAILLWPSAPDGMSQEHRGVEKADAHPEIATAVLPVEAGGGDVGELLVESSPPSKAQAGKSGNLLTLSLTRQQITIPQEDGVYYKTAYWGTLSVGEPPVPFSVVFDTGSGHLILPSSYCHTDTCRVHRRYRRSLSATARDIDYDGSVVAPGEQREHISVSFGTGEVTGVFVEDVVCLGAQEGIPMFNTSDGAPKGGAIALQKSGALPPGCVGLRMIAATDMSEDPFMDFQFDGVLGLGLVGLSQAPEFNFMSVVANMSNQGVGKNPHVFSVFLAESNHEDSEITLGGYSEEHLEGELSWQLVHNPSLGQWMVRIKSIRVDDGEPLNLCLDGECRAIVDTGTSLISVPSPIFPELFELLSHVAPPEPEEECRGPGPKLHFELEGITVTLEPQDYAVLERGDSEAQAVAQEEEVTVEKQLSFENTLPPFVLGSNVSAPVEEVSTCKAMLMAMDLPAPLGPKLFVLGEPVLRRYYTVYDSSSPPRVGFARARHVQLGQPDRKSSSAW